MKMIVDDHVALQTMPVSINTICMDCSFCRCDLNELVEVASSKLAGSLLHLLTTLSEKKWSLRS